MAAHDSPRNVPVQHQLPTNTAVGLDDREFLNFESFADVTRRKGKGVAAGPSNPVGKASFFSPLEVEWVRILDWTFKLIKDGTEVDTVPATLVSSDPNSAAKLEALKAILKEQEEAILNEDSLARVVENLLEPVAEHLRLTSNLGVKFVNFILHVTASQQLKEKHDIVLTEDDQELMNYANSNLAIGKACLDHGF
ncbi:hypothetical protein FRX31_006374 [Thalictrum thalictroides]|uniref:Uncharacterized protein n=1 Tax=Thalictrum thalictroides TaxID=46969 RepID=A0A7J6X5B1_THATH|nr:hypothetical protein FRX31_006374 [Thalictrum thalictroides]